MIRMPSSVLFAVFFCLYHYTPVWAGYSSESMNLAPDNNVCNSFLRSMINGALSGTISTCVYAPFGYAQNRVVQNLPLECKLRCWFIGLPSLVVGKAPTVAAQTGVYTLITDVMKRYGDHEISPLQRSIAATIAGGVSALPDNAAHLIALRQQNNRHHNAARGETIGQTIARLPRGVYSLGRATIPTALCQMLFANTYLAGMPLVCEQLGKRTDNAVVCTAGSTVAVGGAAAVLTQPLRVIITKLHADVEGKHYTGMIDAGKKIIQQEGIGGFWRGSAVRSTGVMVALGMLKAVHNALKAVQG